MSNEQLLYELFLQFASNDITMSWSEFKEFMYHLNIPFTVHESNNKYYFKDVLQYIKENDSSFINERNLAIYNIACRVYRYYDRNRNGTLDLDEYASLCDDIEHVPKIGEYLRIDRDHDDKITLSEFVSFLVNIGAIKKGKY